METPGWSAIDNGIKVSVVPKKYLPNGRSFVAS
jgi:hypothetical protein